MIPKRYNVKRIIGNRMSFLAAFDKLEEAANYAINWSNENGLSSFIYVRDSIKANYFTHKVSENNYQLFR